LQQVTQSLWEMLFRTTGLDEAIERVGTLDTSLQHVMGTASQLDTALQGTTGQVASLGQALGTTTQNVLAHADSHHEVKKAVGETAESIRATREAAIEMGRGLGEVAGLQLPRFIGALAMAGAGEAALIVASAAASVALIKLGADVTESTAEIQNAGRISVEAAHNIQAGFAGLGGSVGKDINELSEAYAGSVGKIQAYTGETLSAAQATEVMKMAAEGAHAANISVDDSLKAMVTEMTASHSSVEELAHIQDVLYNASLATGQSMVTVANQAGYLQARMGAAAPDIDSVAFALVLMNQAGLQGPRALQLVSTALDGLAHPSAEASKYMEDLNIEMSYNAKGGIDLVGTLISIKSAYEGLHTPTERQALLTALFGKNSDVMAQALKTSGERMAEMDTHLTQNGTVTEAAGVKADTLSGRLEAVGAQAKNVGNILGGIVASGITTLWASQFDALGTSANNAKNAIQGAINAARFKPAEPKEGGQTVETPEGFGEGGEFGFLATSANRPQLAPPGEERGTRLRVSPEEIQANAAYTASLGAQGAAIRNILLEINEIDQKGALSEEARFQAVNRLSAAFQDQTQYVKAAYDPARPEEMEQRLTKLAQLQAEYDKALNIGTVEERNRAGEALNAYNAQITREDALRQTQDKNAQYARQQAADVAAAERKRQQDARDAAQRDIGTGLAGLPGAIEAAAAAIDLEGPAVQLMERFYGALNAAGTDKAAQAGEALSSAIVSVSNEMLKAGLPDYAEKMAQLADVAQAIRRGEPGAIQAAHDVALGVSQALTEAAESKKDIEFWNKWEQASQDAVEAATRAQEEYEEKVATARQADLDRLHDIGDQLSINGQIEEARARVAHEVQAATNAEADAVQQLRYEREDLDFKEEQGRQKASESLNAQRSERDAGINEARQRTQMLRDHQDRLAEIAKSGAKDAADQIARENEQYQKRLRQLGELSQTQKQDRDRHAADRAADEQLADRYHTKDTTRARERQRLDTDIARAWTEYLNAPRGGLQAQLGQQAAIFNPITGQFYGIDQDSQARMQAEVAVAQSGRQLQQGGATAYRELGRTLDTGARSTENRLRDWWHQRYGWDREEELAAALTATQGTTANPIGPRSVEQLAPTTINMQAPHLSPANAGAAQTMQTIQGAGTIQIGQIVNTGVILGTDFGSIVGGITNEITQRVQNLHNITGIH
jgi:hypothetical protein